MSILSILGTLFIFGSCGFYLSEKFNKYHSASALVILVFAVIICKSIGEGVILFGIKDFVLYLNHALQSLFLGALIEVIKARSKERFAKRLKSL